MMEFCGKLHCTCRNKSKEVLTARLMIGSSDGEAKGERDVKIFSPLMQTINFPSLYCCTWCKSSAKDLLRLHTNNHLQKIIIGEHSVLSYNLTNQMVIHVNVMNFKLKSKT